MISEVNMNGASNIFFSLLTFEPQLKQHYKIKGIKRTWWIMKVVVGVDEDAWSRCRHYLDLRLKTESGEIFQFFIRLQQRKFLIWGRSKIGFPFYIGLFSLRLDLNIGGGCVFTESGIESLLRCRWSSDDFRIFTRTRPRHQNIILPSQRKNKSNAEAFLKANPCVTIEKRDHCLLIRSQTLKPSTSW